MKRVESISSSIVRVPNDAKLMNTFFRSSVGCKWAEWLPGVRLLLPCSSLSYRQSRFDSNTTFHPQFTPPKNENKREEDSHSDETPSVVRSSCRARLILIRR